MKKNCHKCFIHFVMRVVDLELHLNFNHSLQVNKVVETTYRVNDLMTAASHLPYFCLYLKFEFQIILCNNLKVIV